MARGGKPNGVDWYESIRKDWNQKHIKPGLAPHAFQDHPLDGTDLACQPRRVRGDFCGAPN